ncbi:C39 family peptidase [Candidatus Kaiserbacteria bacterium]|nr:C39 family peptidase [Candidatus Kaiserbacteria bacterium]
MKTLEVPYFKQDTPYDCGPTALQMVLAYHGMHDSEKHLARLLHTNSTVGTRRQEMYELAVELGFHCYVNNEANFHEIRFLLDLGVPPIVRFVEPDGEEDHYGVVVGSTEHALTLHDPWNGPEILYTEADFVGRWTCDVLGECDQWLMAVSQEPLPLGHQFHPE